MQKIEYAGKSFEWQNCAFQKILSTYRTWRPKKVKCMKKKDGGFCHPDICPDLATKRALERIIRIIKEE
jgi:hypothetical protein